MNNDQQRKNADFLQKNPVKAMETSFPAPKSPYECPELSFSAPLSLEKAIQLFQNAQPCPLRQSWLPKEEPGFACAVVRAGWQAQSLLVFAEMTDVDIYNDATEFDTRLWEFGDVFEMFLRPSEQSSYMELHVTPQNRQMQLRYPGAEGVERVRKGAGLDEFMIRDGAFRSATWVRPEEKKWFVYAEIPSSLVCEKPGQLAGSRWHFSFCRYDYTRGCSEPVISSTSLLQKPDFHRQSEWGEIHFASQKK